MRRGNQPNGSTGPHFPPSTTPEIAYTLNGSTGHHYPPSTTPEIAYTVNCKLEFDGACRGNPGPAGAGAILSDDFGRVYRFREGVGYATNNIAEYRALILGLSKALEKGYQNIHVEGDSMLVCNQVRGTWRINDSNLIYLCGVANQLVNRFRSFTITHVARESNIEADKEANRAISLAEGQVEEASG